MESGLRRGLALGKHCEGAGGRRVVGLVRYRLLPTIAVVAVDVAVDDALRCVFACCLRKL